MLGNSIGRFVLSANTIDTSGLITGGAGATITGQVNASTGFGSGTIGAASNGYFANSTTISLGNTSVNVAITTAGITSSGGTGVNPSSNTVGTALGTTTQRWVINANTGNFTGTVTGTVANMSTSVNSALLTVGTSFIANTSQITIAAGVPLSANGGVGSAGQILTSNGSVGSPYWATASGGGATVTDNTTFNGTTYPVFANQTSGTLSTAFVSSTKLTYNPSTGQLGATLFSSSSDERLKTNINLIEQSLSKIEQIRGVTFNYIDNNHASVGVIAQDVEKVLPQAVSIDEEGYKAVHYNGVIGLLVEAVKQQQLQIEDLQNQINELKK